jgi:peroxiredoxin (alkyl hydroperoxide reductase subunit C)|tara:strand:+ start:4193 stop:4585 length:393 start_codon:yes stop_codon:yes gene_type:complete
MDVNKGGIGNVKYPLVSDLDKSIARSYDVLLDSTPATVLLEEEEMDTTIGGNVTMRGSFLIDEEGVVRHAVLNDLPLGRNIDEMLRMVDALAFHTEHGDVCPAGWQEGKTAMNPSDDGMRKYMAEEANNL